MNCKLLLAAGLCAALQRIRPSIPDPSMIVGPIHKL